MTFEDVRRLDRLPAMWAVLLYRIDHSEERDRILRDWEDVVFGPVLRQDRGLGIAALSDVLGIDGDVIAKRRPLLSAAVFSRPVFPCQPNFSKWKQVLSVWSRDPLVVRQTRTQHFGRRTPPLHDP
jgi:hypothetical protein